MVEVLRKAPERTADDPLVRELERLWETPAAAPVAAAPAVSRARSRTYDGLVRALLCGWPTVLVAVFVFAPAPAPEASYASWVVAASLALLLGPLAAGLVAMKGSALPALGLSASLGGLGIAVGIACRATAHHTGAWWAVETAAFAALAAVSVLALAFRPRS